MLPHYSAETPLRLINETTAFFKSIGLDLGGRKLDIAFGENNFAPKGRTPTRGLDLHFAEKTSNATIENVYCFSLSPTPSIK